MHTNKKNSVLPAFLYKTSTRINYFHVTNKAILSILKSLDSNKPHECNNISIKTIKVCSGSVTISVKIIFEESLKNEYRKNMEIWKKANVVSIHKKEDKTLRKITFLLVYFLFLVKYLKGHFLV